MSGPAIEYAMDARGRDEHQMHRPQLRIHSRSTPHIAAEVEVIADARGEQGRKSGADRSRRDREFHSPHRQIDSEGKQDHQQVAHQVEEREEIYAPENQELESDNDEMRQMLIIEELGETQF